ncbi:MAG: sulfate/thiosulfate ABC transporter permease CysW, partial [Enterobacteriaceae bacterium]
MSQTLSQVHPRRARVDGVRIFLIALGMVLSFLFLVVPLASIFLSAFAGGIAEVWRNLHDKEMLHAIGLTLLVALITVPVNMVFGTLFAWLITRFSFPGRQLLLTLIDIPFAVSPVVAGLLYLLLYGNGGLMGDWLGQWD